jgi:hypothetical protein
MPPLRYRYASATSGACIASPVSSCCDERRRRRDVAVAGRPLPAVRYARTDAAPRARAARARRSDELAIARQLDDRREPRLPFRCQLPGQRIGCTAGTLVASPPTIAVARIRARLSRAWSSASDVGSRAANADAACRARRSDREPARRDDDRRRAEQPLELLARVLGMRVTLDREREPVREIDFARVRSRCERRDRRTEHRARARPRR